MPGSGGFSPTTVCRPGKGFDWNAGENSAGLSDYAPPDMRTIEEIDCAMCELNCAMVSLFLPGPMIPVSKKELAEFAGWGAAGWGMCHLACKDKSNEDKCGK